MKLCDNANGFSLHYNNNEFQLWQEATGCVIKLAAFSELNKALHYSISRAIIFDLKVCPICKGKINNHYWKHPNV